MLPVVDKQITSSAFALDWQGEMGKKDSLVHIFKQLSLLDIFSCSCTSKEWNIAASDNGLWEFFISKTFLPSSNCFLSDKNLQVSQKEIFKYTYNLELGGVGYFLEEKFPESGSFHHLQQNGKHFLISESGAVYLWNQKTQKFDLIQNLWQLPESNEFPYNCYKVSLCVSKAFGITKDTFAVLCDKSGQEVIKHWGKSPKVKKVKGSLIKVFDNKYKEIKEISINTKLVDFRFVGNDQFIGMTDSHDLINISGKFVQTHEFTNRSSKSIISLYREKCLVLGSIDKNFESIPTISLFDIDQGTKLIGEMSISYPPICPFNSESFDHRFILLPSEKSCQIFDLDQAFDAPMVEIPFGHEFIALATFTKQGKLLLSNSGGSKIVLLDPQNGWKEVQAEVKYSKEEKRTKNGSQFLSHYDDQTFVYHWTHFKGSVEPMKNDQVIGEGIFLREGNLMNCDPSTKNMILKLADLDGLILRGAVDGFELLPKRIRNAIFGELYGILKEKGKLSGIDPYWGMGEDAFLGNGKMKGIATAADKILAMKRVANSL